MSAFESSSISNAATSSNGAGHAMEVFRRLQYSYLPELQNLHRECMWLRSKLGIDSKNELQTSETRLIQFCGMVDAVVRQILNLNRIPVSDNNYHHYVELENRIMKSILPVKERLQDRLNESRNDPAYAQAMAGRDGNVATHKPPSTLSLPSESSGPTFASNSWTKSEGLSGRSSSCDYWAQLNNNYENEFSSYAQNLQSRMVPAHLSSVEDYLNMPVENVLAQSNQSGKAGGKGADATSKCALAKKAKVTGAASKKAKESSTSTAASETVSPPTAHPPLNSSFPPGSPKTITVTRSLQSIGGSTPGGGSASSLVSAMQSANASASSSRSGPVRSDELHVSAHDALMASEVKGDRAGQVVPGTKRHFDVVAAEKTSVKVEGGAAEMCTLVDEETMRNPSRRRRRISQLVPFPRKPREANYTCSSCSEGYLMTVVENPWWAVFKHDCPNCKGTQIPRIDINLAANAIELDPNVTALYGEGMEDSDGDYDDDDDEESDAEDGEDDGSVEVDGKDAHPFDGDGLLAQEQASKLLVLMSHARTCTGVHASPKHAEICRSTKYLMLHIRDCNGTDVHGRPCQFPWCLPCKKMLRHLTHCYEPGNCKVCNPWNLPESLKKLRALNQLRTPKVSDAILKKLPVPGSKPANASGASTPATPPVVPGGSGPPGGSTIAGPGKESLLAACQPCSAH